MSTITDSAQAIKRDAQGLKDYPDYPERYELFVRMLRNVEAILVAVAAREAQTRQAIEHLEAIASLATECLWPENGNAEYSAREIKTRVKAALNLLAGEAP